MKEIALKEEPLNYRRSEAYKILRTNVGFAGVENKVIAITSCMPNEGKSTTALQLALALTDAGEKVLFIDADMRKSTLPSKFHLTGKVRGLSHFLAGKLEIGDVLYKVKNKDLAVMFAGVVPPNPAELLGHKRFAGLLNSARKTYDHIIVDTPPLGSVIDAAIITKSCDASILVIASHEISRKFALGVKNQLERSGCPILGAVLNKVDLKQNKYYGKYYSNYYYGEK